MLRAVESSPLSLWPPPGLLTVGAVYQKEQDMPSGHIRLAVVLGLLTLAGPFAIDMYLPALPEMATDLGMTEGAAQLTLMSFFITFGISQMVYGPWSDQVGRKIPIYVGMGLFLGASIGASMASTAGELILWRAA